MYSSDTCGNKSILRIVVRSELHENYRTYWWTWSGWFLLWVFSRFWSGTLYFVWFSFFFQGESEIFTKSSIVLIWDFQFGSDLGFFWFDYLVHLWVNASCVVGQAAYQTEPCQFREISRFIWLIPTHFTTTVRWYGESSDNPQISALIWRSWNRKSTNKASHLK